jgi:hypothetical protein
MNEIPFCNHGHPRTNLCFGSTFPCPERDSYIKIKININSIRLIMKRIYWCRKSGLEIFTNNKSYYFNFPVNPLTKKNEFKNGEKNCSEFFDLISKNLKPSLYPLYVKQQIIGYMALSKNLINKEEKIDPKAIIFNYILSPWRDNECKYSNDKKDISTFDMITLLNLISNRSYNDIFQYPVFPLVIFYEKIKGENKDNNPVPKYALFKRDLTNHIGFQTVTEGNKSRKDMIIKGYKSNIEEAKVKRKKVKKVQKEYNPFPNEQQPRKIDLLLQSGDYFFDEKNRSKKESNKKIKKKIENKEIEDEKLKKRQENQKERNEKKRN